MTNKIMLSGGAYIPKDDMTDIFNSYAFFDIG
jgi:hypothetical protein